MEGIQHRVVLRVSRHCICGLVESTSRFLEFMARKVRRRGIRRPVASTHGDQRPAVCGGRCRRHGSCFRTNKWQTGQRTVTA